MLIICLLICAGAARADLVGPARIIDGDTVQIGTTIIRLHGIDAPEATQTCNTAQGVAFACGVVATQALAQLVGTVRVDCTPLDVDRYGRTVAHCAVAGRDLGRDMVARGYATAYRRYSRAYVTEEDAARGDRRGFWSGTMLDPAAFRAAQVAVPDTATTCPIKGNISAGGHIYHLPGQEHYAATRISPAKGERWFCDEAEARAAGWRAARR